jgi:hypothetical protein
MNVEVREMIGVYNDGNDDVAMRCYASKKERTILNSLNPNLQNQLLASTQENRYNKIQG